MQALNIPIFGIIAVSLDVGIVKVFVFYAIWVCLHLDFNTLLYSRIHGNFRARKSPPHPKSEGAPTPMTINLSSVHPSLPSGDGKKRETLGTR